METATKPHTHPKISGYLEKKGKKKMMSCYKKYWFLLEGQLLLYYRSKDEYEAISPCKGSITLGPTCTIKPCTSHIGVFQVHTRSSTVTLRADSREEQNKWMQAIMSAINQQSSSSKLSHFRYSLHELPQIDTQRPKLERQNTLPTLNPKPSYKETVVGRLQKIGGKSYGGTTSHTALKISKKKCKNNKSSSTDESCSSQSRRSSEELTKENNSLELGGTYSDNGNISGSDNIYERIPSSDSISPDSTKESFYLSQSKDSVLMEKKPHNSDSQKYEDNERIYAEPKFSQDVDFNENTLTTCNLPPLPTPNQKTNKENQYDDLVNDHQYMVIESSSSDSSKEEKAKDKKRKKKDKKNNEKSVKVKKSSSFMRRVWKKKPKISETCPDETIYETVPENVPVLDTRIGKTETSNKNSEQILTTQENNLNTTIITERNYNLEKTIHEYQEAKELYQKHSREIQSDDQICPAVPPKKRQIEALRHDSHFNQNRTVDNLDIILNDLDKLIVKPTSKEPENNVKELIKKFSMREGIDENVELRKNKTCHYLREASDPNELNKLLNDLAQITVAPVMTPGVTLSLIGSNLTDEELMKLVPIRRRRISDPDYDIPRPHKSLVNLPRKEETDLVATRFFGPVLNPLKMNICKNTEFTTTDNSSRWTSITPDSLETHSKPKHQQVEDDHNVSYQSHDYFIHRPALNNNSEIRKEYFEPKTICDWKYPLYATPGEYQVENTLYALPNPRRSHVVTNTIFYDSSVNKNTEDSNDNVFIDSLE